MLIQTGLKQSKAAEKAATSKRERRKEEWQQERPMPCMPLAWGRLESLRKERLRRFQNCFYLLSSFSSGWIQVSLSPLATAILVFEGTTSKGGTETLCKR